MSVGMTFLEVAFDFPLPSVFLDGSSILLGVAITAVAMIFDWSKATFAGS